MKRKSPAPAILIALLLTTSPIAGHAQTHDAMNTTEERTPAEQLDGDVTDTETHPVRDSGIGCATGAVLGSVLPGLGNVVGCLAGGFLGWWHNHRRQSVSAQ